MNENKLIVALDVPTAREAREIFEELRETGCAFKIGMQLFTAAGSAFVRELVDKGVRIFLDLKFHDIPNTVASAGVEAARLGVWMFNVHALGGREMMQRTVEAVRAVAARENLVSPKIIAVTILTSSDQTILKEIGIENELESQVTKLAKLAAESGLDGVVASAQEAAQIKAKRKEIVTSKELQQDDENAKDFLVVTPGIRSASASDSSHFVSKDDQKRVLTARDAIAAGSDYLVLGRPILAAPDKVKAAKEILLEIQTTLRSRNIRSS